MNRTKGFQGNKNYVPDMEWTMRRVAVLTGGTGFIGAVVFFALTFYPFDYEPIDSAVLITGFILLVILQITLNDATFGAKD